MGITFIGPDFFARDEKGDLLSPIASVFPKYRTIVSVRGIHAYHASIMLELLKRRSPEKDLREIEKCELDIYQDAVSLFIRDALILVRSDPSDMEHIFAADQILQFFFPRERIQFTGLHIPEIRRQLRLRGESWRMSPTPRSIEEVCCHVQASKVQVSTGLTVYYNAPTGGRFLTYDEFIRIRALLEQDRSEALARLREVLNLFQRENSLGVRELSFFLPADISLDFADLEKVVSLLKVLPTSDSTEKVQGAFDRFASHFAQSAGTELMVDDCRNPVWRTTMFCRLFDINEEEIEEWALDLSPEFHLNVKWLPGASIVGDELRLDAEVHNRVQGLISHFWEKSGGLISINVGRIEESQSSREASGEEREVYLVVMTTRDGQDSIRILRLMKWDVIHRIKMGIPLEQAVTETIKYRNYIFDRLHAAAQLGFPILSYSEIRLDERVPGLGLIPAFFFERQYISGVVTDKIPISCYRNPNFIKSLSGLLGGAATFTLVLGRASPRTGKIFYDDGDEVIQFNSRSIPSRLIIIETTGSFTDWTTPLLAMLPQCLTRFRAHLDKALESGVPLQVINSSMAIFAEALCNKLHEIKEIALAPCSNIRFLFNDRTPEQGGIRDRWEGIIYRLETTDLEELHGYMLNSPELRFTRPG
ncbi:MAG: hypothetical protein ABSF52_14845 [Syntrophobacteraceae bacterium]